MWAIQLPKTPKIKFSQAAGSPSSLRAALIHKQQIRDLLSVFRKRKAHYKIPDRTVTLPSNIQQEQHLQHIYKSKRFKEKITQYKIKKYQTKLSLKNVIQADEKQSELNLGDLKGKSLQKLMQECERGHHFDQNNLNIRAQFKESINNLFKLRINENNKFTNENGAESNLCFSRSNFISLSNGKPEKPTRHSAYPRWTDYGQSDIKRPLPGQKSLDIANIQTKLRQIIDKSCVVKRKHRRKTVQNDSSRKYQFAGNTLNTFISARNLQVHSQDEEQILQDELDEQKAGITNRKVKERYMINRIHSNDKKHSFIFKQKGANNTEQQDYSCLKAIKALLKSQKSSQKMLNTMQDYYESKLKKKQEFKNDLLCLKSDRKLTLDIRRKNFNMIGLKKLKQMRQYRFSSQKDRCLLKQQNKAFYLGLLNKMFAYKIEEIPLSGQMVDRLRTVLNSHYKLQQIHYNMIVQPALYQQADPFSDYLMEQIATLLKR